MESRNGWMAASPWPAWPWKTSPRSTIPRRLGRLSCVRPWAPPSLKSIWACSKMAPSSKTLTLTKPYVDASSHKLVITLAAPLFDGGALKGVFGADLELEAINQFLQTFKLGGRGFVFLIDEDGTVLVHPDADKVMKPLGIKPGESAGQTLEDGGDQILRFYPISGLPTVKWYVGVSM